MLEKIIYIYVRLFGRPYFQMLNKVLYRLSLGGLGILNHATSSISGEKAFLKKTLSFTEGTVVDIGANKGSYTLEALAFNNKIKVFAFEPHPATFKLLVRNVAAYSNVIPLNKGMSSKSGILKLYDYPANDGSSHASLYQDVITEIHGAGAAVAHDVELITLDQFMEAENLSKIDLLKIDTEGNELAVLQGAANAILGGKIKVIHFEFNAMNVSSRVFFRDFWRILRQYRFYRLLPKDLLEIKNYSPLGCEIFGYQNIVAILED
jgi:FkbM family methyltransferase